MYRDSWNCFEIYKYRYPGKILSGSRVSLLFLPGRGLFDSTINCFLYSESLDRLSPAGYVSEPLSHSSVFIYCSSWMDIHSVVFLERGLYRRAHVIYILFLIPLTGTQWLIINACWVCLSFLYYNIEYLRQTMKDRERGGEGTGEKMGKDWEKVGGWEEICCVIYI